jgi:hypothetical protein
LNGVRRAALAGLATLGLSCGDSGTAPQALSPFLQDVIEALFLGSGALSPADDERACVTHPGRWAAFPRGSRVRVVLSDTLDRGSDGVDTRMLIEAALAGVEEATAGHIRVTVELTSDPDPLPAAGEVTATDHPAPVDTGCPFDRGCVHVTFADSARTVIASARVVLREDAQPADAFVHDLIGHGILGLCHIDQAAIGGNDKSLMAGGPGAYSGFLPDALSELDVAAVRAVYGSGLQPGARRADFVAAGLVRPLPGP